MIRNPLPPQLVREIAQTPRVFYLLEFLLLILTIILRWDRNTLISAGVLLAGGGIGAILLPTAESFFQLRPSPFRSTPFQTILSVLLVYVITSSGSVFAIGIAMTFYFHLCLLMISSLEPISSFSSARRETVVSVMSYGVVLAVAVFLFVR